MTAQSVPRGKRVALVLGNSTYSQLPKLNSPTLDAAAIGDRLKELGFEVELAVDRDLKGMQRALLKFDRMLPGAEMAWMFFSGHGVSVGGQSYLLPVDADPRQEDEVAYQAVEAQSVVKRMQEFATVTVVVLDACRSSLPKLQRGSKATSKNVVLITPGPGDFAVLYATAEGREAQDGGKGQKSPFTQALLEEIQNPGLSLQIILPNVVAKVKRLTSQQQQPVTLVSISKLIYLAEECRPGTAGAGGPCVSDRLPAQRPALTVPATATNQPSTPVFKKWWFWTAIGVAVGLGIAIPVGITQSQKAYQPFN